MNIKQVLFAAALLLCAAGAGGVEMNYSDDNSGFVLLAEAVPDVILEPRYYSTFNFVGSRIDGYEAPCMLITREAAEALGAVAAELKERGYRLKVWDAYRPQCAVDHFARWAKDLSDTTMRPYFYPKVDKSVLFEQDYIAYHSGHTRGSTVDLTLFDMRTRKDVDMGGTLDFFGIESHPSYKALTEQQLANRQILPGQRAVSQHVFHVPGEMSGE